MAPKPVGKAKANTIVRLPISSSSLVTVPHDAVEGFQERIETGIDWTLFDASCRHHKQRCLKADMTPLSFTEALDNTIRKSYLNSFMFDDSGMTLEELWELILPIKLWDIEKCANEEEKICFHSANCITDNVIQMIEKAVKTNDRNRLRQDLKNVTVLRVAYANMTNLDKKLLEFSQLITLNLSGNFISTLECDFIPEGLRSIELQCNSFLLLDSLNGLPDDLLYLGLSRNLLDNVSIDGFQYLPQQLVVLDLSDNDIYNLEPLLTMLARLPNLTSLTLAGNPCSVCLGYARATFAALPNLQWLDDRQVLLSDKNGEPYESHPDDFRSTFFTFNVFRIMAVPQPPKPTEKGTTLTFHVELELPLLDSTRRGFLMYRQNESLTEILPSPEESWVSEVSPKNVSLEDGAEASSSEELDIYAQLVPKNSRIIKNYTTFQSNKISWNKIMNFQEPLLRIFCPDLVALRDTFRTVVTVRLVFTQYTTPPKAGKPTKSAIALTNAKPVPAEQFRVIFEVKCSLRRLDWSQPSQHFHWDETLGTDDAIYWGDGDLSILQYTLPGAKPTKGKNEPDTADLKQIIPDIMTAHFGFGVHHERWGSQLEYLLSCLGYAVGIGNLWRFPYLCYRNGGGAFLIPYFLTLIVCGIPLVYLETTLGQFASAGCISVFNINPLFKGAGYAVCVLNVIAIIYFSSIMSYPVLYIYHSFTYPLPWQSCGNSWNTDKCTEFQTAGNLTVSDSNASITTPEDEFFHIRLLNMSPSIDEIGGIVWPVFWCNVICWIIIYMCICNGVKSVGKIVYFTVLFPYVVLCVLLIRGVTLPGALQGIKFYILPDWKQLKNPKVWADAATQIFYSLGPGWGGLVSMASFNRFHYKNKISSIIIPLVNSGTSIWAGFVVFSVLGFAAERAGVPVGQVATAGPGLAFVTYPAAVTLMPAPNFWAVTFFVTLFFLGIDTLFVTIEAVIAGILDEFPKLRPRKRLVTLLTCLILFSLSIICNTEGGLHVVTLLDSHVAIACVPIVCLLEVVAAVYTYGPRKLTFDVKFMTGQPLGTFWLLLWRYILPVILVVITVYTLREASGLAGWSVALASVICIPIHALRVIYLSRGPLIQRVRENCRASPCWGPAQPEERELWLAAKKLQRDGDETLLNDFNKNP